MKRPLCVCLCVTVHTQLCLILCDPMDCSVPGSSVHGISQDKNTGVGCHFLLQGGDIPDPEIKPRSPALQADSLLSHQLFSLELSSEVQKITRQLLPICGKQIIFASVKLSYSNPFVWEIWVLKFLTLINRCEQISIYQLKSQPLSCLNLQGFYILLGQNDIKCHSQQF